ncbi:MAG: aminotransferase class I/II-fold pyridoxal phosphate-dependent enzyme [Bacillota bacterium]|nr:aminotransferase class I/II-fold pyridoxal phosphate-dependent enzyme [Bacillota bacterium]
MKKPSLAAQLESLMNPPLVSFHTPGHKQGALYRRAASAQEPLLPAFLPGLDTTEIPGTDNLHHPTGILRAAQVRAAHFYGSEESFFLVNGSTCGVYAMILAAALPGEEIVISRNAHQSVYHACLLGGITPRYLVPELDPELGLPMGIDAAAVEKALKTWPQVKAVVITRPTYHGYAPDLAAIARTAADNGKLLLVDEAHGAHLRLSERLPADAMACGADAAVQSTHKTLSAFTQAAMLHVRGNLLDRDRLRLMLRLFQTSSPSYLLMSSLDAAVRLAQTRGSDMMERLLDNLAELRRQLARMSRLQFSGRPSGNVSSQPIDPTRLWIDLHGTGLSGYELNRHLREEWRIGMELADRRGVLALTSIGNTREELTRLQRALQTLSEKSPADPGAKIDHQAAARQLPELTRHYRDLPPAVLSLQAASHAPREAIPLEEAAGRICAESLIPYPPGIPLVVPGEIIRRELIEELKELAEAGIEMIGIQPPSPESADATFITVVVNP